MLQLGAATKIYLAAGITDMRNYVESPLMRTSGDARGL